MNDPFWIWLLLWYPRRLIIELEHWREIKKLRKMPHKHLAHFYEQIENVTYILRKGLF